MRNQKLWKKILSVVLSATAMATMMVGCSQPTSSSADASKADDTTKSSEATPAKTDAKKIKIGIGNAYSPFCYLDEDEKETGYDYDVITAVGEELKDKYTFDIQPDAFANLLIGLDTGAYDVAIHHFAYNAKRAENYLYATQGDMYINYFVVGYPKGKEGITDLASCKGLTAVTTTGSQADNMLQAWNTNNPDSQVKIAYAEGGEVISSGLKNGLYDFDLLSEYDFKVFNDQYGDVLDKSENTDDYVKQENPGIYFVYDNKQTELQKDIDEAIVKLRESGKLGELSKKWLGEDFSQPLK